MKFIISFYLAIIIISRSIVCMHQNQEESLKALYIAAWIVDKENDLHSHFDIFQIKDSSLGTGNEHNSNSKLSVEYFSTPRGMITKQCTPYKIVKVPLEQKVVPFELAYKNKKITIQKKLMFNSSHLFVALLTLLACSSYHLLYR